MHINKITQTPVGADYGDEHKNVNDQGREYSRVACHPERSEGSRAGQLDASRSFP